MRANPPDLRPDRAPAPRLDPEARPDARPGQPRVGMVSLGCPKALVDSERILTRLRAEGYAVSPDYAGADTVIVNTCGFLDSAKAESLEAIGEALAENGRVIVTGCLGADESLIRAAHPAVLAVTGPHQYEAVLDAVHAAVPPKPDPFLDLLPPAAVHLTPRHYSYLKISEGCNHKCRFCIIPDMRGRLVSRPAHAVLREAEKLVAAGVRELLVISQDTSAYGVDRRHDAHPWKGGEVRTHITDLARELGQLGAWVRLHYVYPYPHVRELVPLMAEGLHPPLPRHPLPALPPRRPPPHGPPGRRRPHPRRDRPLARRLPRARPPLHLHRRLPRRDRGRVPAPPRLARRGPARPRRLLPLRERQGRPRQRPPRPRPRGGQGGALAALHGKGPRRSAPPGSPARVGTRIEVVVDEVDAEAATCRTRGDAPEIDGNLFIDEDFSHLRPGDRVTVTVEEADDYDLWGRI